MDAKMNSVSPVLPDLNLRNDKAAPDLKNEKGPSFDSVLDRAQKDEPKVTRTSVKAEAKAEAKVEKQETPSQVEDIVPQKPMKVSKATTKAVEAIPEKEEIKGIDDKAGVIAQSYDGIAVSYPLSKIAKESLDEKTVTKLKDAGLWDLPTLVMAQPSPQLIAMKEMGSEIKVQDSFPMAKPIAQFMASLENELGIEPDRLVQAFQQLPPGQLSEPPEKTMAQVVKNLGLAPKDEARATALFSKMLTQMKAIENQSMDPALLATVAASSQGAVAPQVMNEKTAVKVDEKAPPIGKVQVATSRYAQNTGAEKTVEVIKTPKPAEVANVSKEELQTFPRDAKVTETPNTLTKPVVNIESQNVTAVPVEKQAEKANHSQTPDIFTANQLSAHQNPMDDKSVKEIVKGVKDSKETLTVKGATQASGAATPIVPQDSVAIAKSDVAGSAVTAGGVANAEMKAGNDSKHEAIRSIVNQAQMLAQKGGGEIRMTLKPDHLGEIQLKVAMEGNRVNVSMTAERGEVKKLIEQSVHELRHGLATHNLSMDKLDVSVSNRDTSGFKGQPDFGAAKDFANQFHNQQQNRREMMEDLSSIRGNALKSMTAVDRSSQVQKTLSARNNGRLNVVA